MKGMTIAQFFKACEAHDFFYQYADDSRVYNAGSSNEASILWDSNGDQVKKDIWKAWKRYRNGEGARPILEVYDS